MQLSSISSTLSQQLADSRIDSAQEAPVSSSALSAALTAPSNYSEARETQQNRIPTDPQTSAQSTNQSRTAKEGKAETKEGIGASMLEKLREMIKKVQEQIAELQQQLAQAQAQASPDDPASQTLVETLSGQLSTLQTELVVLQNAYVEAVKNSKPTNYFEKNDVPNLPTPQTTGQMVNTSA